MPRNRQQQKNLRRPTKIIQIKYLIALACGSVSGLISSLIINFPEDHTLLWFPGTIFGLFFSCYYLWATSSHQSRLKDLMWLLFIGLSTAAYFAATVVFVNLFKGFWFHGVMAGFTGSVILVLSIWLCSLRMPSWRNAMITLLMGSVLGSLSIFASASYILFVPWQTVVFVGLVSILPKDLLEDNTKKAEPQC